MPPKRRTPQVEVEDTRVKLRSEAKRLFGAVNYMGHKTPDWKSPEGFPNNGGDIVLVCITYCYQLVFIEFLGFIAEWYEVREKAWKRHQIKVEVGDIQSEYSTLNNEDEARFLICEMEKLERESLFIAYKEKNSWLLQLEDKHVIFRKLYCSERTVKNIKNFLSYEGAARADIVSGEKEDRANMKMAFKLKKF